MPETVNVLEQVKTVMDSKRITVAKLAKDTGIPPSRIYKWIDGTANPKSDDAEKLEKWVEQIAAGIPTADLSKPQEIHKIRLSLADGRRYDMTDGPVAGTFETWNNESTVVLDFMKAPFIGELEGVVEVTGDDMIPTFRPGTRVAVQRLSDPKIFTPGQFYFIIDRNGQSFVRRMMEGTRDDVILKSDNERLYPQFKRNWRDIKAVFKIKADINRL
jgi:phage repressor protein C with HTH and peptisase S24 domain